MRSAEDSQSTKTEAIEEENRVAFEKARSLVDDLKSVQEHEINILETSPSETTLG